MASNCAPSFNRYRAGCDWKVTNSDRLPDERGVERDGGIATGPSRAFRRWMKKCEARPQTVYATPAVEGWVGFRTRAGYTSESRACSSPRVQVISSRVPVFNRTEY